MNPAVYSGKFLDENDEPTCTLKIIPPGWMYTIMPALHCVLIETG
jgi:hypothetical protein